MHEPDYAQRLQAELTTLETELQHDGIHNPQVATDWIATPDTTTGSSESDTNVTADLAEDAEERQATVALLETRYNEVRAALERIHAGNFGVCEVCSQDIEPARLDANPAARTCITHKDSPAADVE